jgi:WD40 repeat protein
MGKLKNSLKSLIMDNILFKDIRLKLKRSKNKYLTEYYLKRKKEGTPELIKFVKKETKLSYSSCLGIIYIEPLNVIALSTGGSILLYRMADEASEELIKVPGDTMRGLDYVGGDFNYIVAGGDKRIFYIFDLASRSIVFETTIGYIWSIKSLFEYSPDWVAVGTNAKTRVVIYDIRNKQVIKDWEEIHTYVVKCMCHLHDYKSTYLLTGGGDKNIILWDLFDLALKRKFTQTHTDWVEDLKHYKKEFFMSLGNRTVFLWNVNEEASIKQFKVESYSSISIFNHNLYEQPFLILPADKGISIQDFETNDETSRIVQKINDESLGTGDRTIIFEYNNKYYYAQSLNSGFVLFLGQIY